MSTDVCVATGTRAEYGLLVPLLRALQRTPSIRLRLLVTGTHLSQAFGHTVDEIVGDGFVADESVEMVLASDTPSSVVKSMGVGMIGYSDALTRLDPDVVVVLGDRTEAFAVAAAAHVMRVPVAHIHGGELTGGAIDDALRHAITKFADLHFVAAEEYGRRVVQLGEDPRDVYVVGALGLDNIAHLEPLTVAELEADLDGFALGDRFALVTYHPVTLDEHPGAGVKPMIEALDESDLRVLVTRPNADAAWGGVLDDLLEWERARPEKVKCVTSLGWRRYLSAMTHAAVVVGNSSSGVIEAPSVGTPAIDIGSRQQGRLAAASVLRVPAERAEIARALDTALSDDFRAFAREVENPYGDGTAAERIARVLAERAPGLRGVRRAFFDVPAPGARGTV